MLYGCAGSKNRSETVRTGQVAQEIQQVQHRAAEIRNHKSMELPDIERPLVHLTQHCLTDLKMSEMAPGTFCMQSFPPPRTPAPSQSLSCWISTCCANGKPLLMEHSCVCVLRNKSLSTSWGLLFSKWALDCGVHSVWWSFGRKGLHSDTCHNSHYKPSPWMNDPQSTGSLWFLFANDRLTNKTQALAYSGTSRKLVICSSRIPSIPFPSPSPLSSPAQSCLWISALWPSHLLIRIRGSRVHQGEFRLSWAHICVRREFSSLLRLYRTWHHHCRRPRKKWTTVLMAFTWIFEDIFIIIYFYPPPPNFFFLLTIWKWFLNRKCFSFLLLSPEPWFMLGQWFSNCLALGPTF